MINLVNLFFFFKNQYIDQITMIKAQNNSLIQKLKTQIKKMNDQYKMVRELILSGDSNSINQNIAQKFVQNFKENSYREDYKERQKNSPSFFSNQPTYVENTQVASNFTDSDNKSIKNQSVNQASAMLLDKIKKRLNDKKSCQQQKIKIQNNENQGQPSIQNDQTSQLTTFNESITNYKSSLQNQQRLCQQTNNFPAQNQTMYPQDFNGEQSFLVDEQVQAKQQLKKQNQNHPKANTFGIQSLQKQSHFQFRPLDLGKNPGLHQEYLQIDEFFNTFLCQNLVYAPKKQFLKFKIGKSELYHFYRNWRIQKKGHINLIFDKKVIQTRISNQFKKRYTSCKDDRECFVGIMFKDVSVYKAIRNKNIQA